MIRFNPTQAEIHISTIASNLSLLVLFPLLTRIKQSSDFAFTVTYCANDSPHFKAGKALIKVARFKLVQPENC